MPQKKFYAIKNGRFGPSVVTDWNTCCEHTNKFNNAVFKKFNTREAAQAFAFAGNSGGPTSENGATSASGPHLGSCYGGSRAEPVTRAPNSPQKKFYAIRRGRHGKHIVHDWVTCSAHVHGFPNAQYKSFKSLAEADEFINSAALTQTRVPHFSKGDSESTVDIDSPNMPPVPIRRAPLPILPASLQRSSFGKRKIGDINGAQAARARYSTKSGETTRGHSLDGFPSFSEQNAGTSRDDSSTSAGRKKTAARRTPPQVVIYTDGACQGNGKSGARAGIGVFFGTDDPRNVSEPLLGKVQTNQRAELAAIVSALEVLRDDSTTPKSVEIRSDSKYGVNGWNGWLDNWKKNKWKTQQNKEVKNQDLWMKIDRLRAELRSKMDVDLTWVQGHNNEPGNEAADQLAVDGISSKRGAQDK